MFSHISSSVWRTLSHACTLHSGWLLLCRTVQSTVVQYLYFKSRMSGSKHKSNSDVAGTAKKCQMITRETKEKMIERVRQRWSWGPRARPKRNKRKKTWLKKQRASRLRRWQEDFLYLRRHCWVLGTGLKHRTVHEGCSGHSEGNPVLLCHLWWGKKELQPKHHWIIFFKRVDGIESSREPEPVPSASGMSQISACLPSPIANDPSALPSPTSSPSSSQ